MLGRHELLAPLLAALAGACAPHHYTVPESLCADREERIETAAFVVTPPEGSWVTVDATQRRAIQRGLRIANQQLAPELLELPLAVANDSDE